MVFSWRGATRWLVLLVLTMSRLVSQKTSISNRETRRAVPWEQKVLGTDALRGHQPPHRLTSPTTTVGSEMSMWGPQREWRSDLSCY